MGHRGSLKKDHKPFKSKHATKGQLKNQFKGKVEKSTVSTKKTTLNKNDRKNHLKQLKTNKILESNLARKIFEGSNGIEKVVTIICLSNDLSPSNVIQSLIQSTFLNTQPVPQFGEPSVSNYKVDRFKSNLKIIIPENKIMSILDATKISDFTIFAVSATNEVDSDGEAIIRAVIAQGIASVIGVLPNLVTAYPKRNLQLDVRKSLTSYFTHFFPSEDKLYALESDSECLNCIRTICQKVPKSLGWRDSRGYLVSECISVENGNVVVEGSVRGIGFNSNNLVHIPGYGDFSISHIEKLTSKDDMNDIYEPENPETLEELNPEPIELDEIDMDYEELDGVRMDGKTYFHDGSEVPQRKYKVPKGTSEYQSKWLLDDVLEGVSDIEEDEDEEIDEENIEEPEMNQDLEEEAEEDNDMFVDLSPEEEQKQLEFYRAQLKDDLEFPDEIELHPSDSGKEVLSKHRGIKSLGNCDWDVDEQDDSKPEEWTRLLRIANFKTTKNRLVKLAIKNAQVSMGHRVRIHIKPNELLINGLNSGKVVNPAIVPLTVYGLLEHEHKLGVVHFSFENWEGFDESIESSTPIIAQYGPRRQVIQPLFNQHSNTPNNVHKLEKFHHPGTISVATCIAPVFFNQAPMIFFQEASDGSLKLVGQGTFLNVDHTRVIAERSVLTGHPVKIHKNVVTVRYMFFNPNDINWFKAVPLYTPSGRSGFIKESLGTHGYFKANFDGKLSAQDVVAMNLFKRVWPSRSRLYEAT